MTSAEAPSSEMAALESFLESQPQDIRELFQYALAALMVEESKAAWGDESTTADGRIHVNVRTPSGQSFSVAKPGVGDAMLAQMMAIVRQAKDSAVPN